MSNEEKVAETLERVKSRLGRLYSEMDDDEIAMFISVMEKQEENNVDIVERLIEAGADINQVDSKGKTDLIKDAEQGKTYEEIMKRVREEAQNRR
jgi:hypothetical protein